MLSDVGLVAGSMGRGGVRAFVIVLATGIVAAGESGALAFVIVLDSGVGVRLSPLSGMSRNAGNCVRG